MILGLSAAREVVCSRLCVCRDRRPRARNARADSINCIHVTGRRLGTTLGRPGRCRIEREKHVVAFIDEVVETEVTNLFAAFRRLCCVFRINAAAPGAKKRGANVSSTYFPNRHEFLSVDSSRAKIQAFLRIIVASSRRQLYWVYRIIELQHRIRNKLLQT